MSGTRYAITVREHRTFFDTLDAARMAAQDYFERTGNIVGIVEVTK